MVLPELVRKTAEKVLDLYCREKNSARQGCQRSVFAFRIRENRITLFQQHRSCQESSPNLVAPIAQFRFQHDLSQWTLHYRGEDRRWRFYHNAGPTLDLGKLLRHLDADPLHLFWT